MTGTDGVQGKRRLVLRLEPHEELGYWRWRAARVLGRVLSGRRSLALRAAITSTRPWQDSLDVADALAAVMPFATAGLVARRLAQLPPGTSDDWAVGVAVAAYHALSADYEPDSKAAIAADTAHELIRFGVPASTAYRLAKQRMTPVQAHSYAIRRVARMLETDRRIRNGVSRASARRAAARLFP